MHLSSKIILELLVKDIMLKLENLLKIKILLLKKIVKVERASFHFLKKLLIWKVKVGQYMMHY